MNNTYYNEKLETLSENLQYAVMMSNWKESLVQIQTQFKLHIDQTQVLEDCTIKLMFGDIDAPDFINHMFSDAHINSEMAADILLEVDLKILKKTRETLEGLEETEKEEEEIENFLLDDGERKARAEDDAYAKYYAEVAKIREDDDASEPDIDEEEEEIPTNISQEKDDLLNEINSPSKSFTIGLTKNQPIQPAPQPIPVDHQLENIHLEEPFHPEEFIADLPKTEIPVQPTSTLVKISTTLDLKPEIKKPITINLDDIYREPLE
jgi:hypothetical protein